MKKLKPLLAALALSTSSLAFAGPYVGADYSFFDADIVDLGAVAFKAGYQLNDWAAIEARVGFGADDDSYQGVKVEIEEYYGAYFVAGLPNDTMFYPYVIAGYTHAEVKASANGLSAKEDDSDFSYGIGTRLNFSESLSGNLEFMRYMDSSDGDLDAISVGLIYKF